jgi:hypothetical protein
VTSPIVHKIVMASIEAARERIVDAACEADLRRNCETAACLIVHFAVDRSCSEENAFLRGAAALGAFLYVDAFALHFPNTELMLKRVNEGQDLLLRMMKEP